MSLPITVRGLTRNMSAASNRLSVMRKQLSSIPQSFKAAECQELKKPLVVKSIENPPLADDEIRIKTKACGLNFATYLTTRGEYQVKKEPPFVPGNEIAGYVVEVGKDVSRFSCGDVVVGLLDEGGLQEYNTVPEYALELGALNKVTSCDKSTADYAKLASVMVNYGTAWMALTRKGLVKEGDVVLVTGASGGVGLAAVELASKVFKCEVVAVCRGEKAEQVRAYGANHIIDYTKQNIRQEVKGISPGGVDIVFDTVGGDGAIDLVKSLAFEGRFITIGYTAGIPKIPANILLLKSATAVGLWWGNTMQTAPEVFKESIHTVLQMYLNKQIDPLIQEELPLDQVNKGFEMIASRKVVGKLMVTM